MESIVIDDEHEIINLTENDIINLDDEQTDDIELIETPNNGYKYRFDEIHKEDPEFGDFIEKCLGVDSSTGMLRVINRILVPLYYENGRIFKSTWDAKIFNRALTKAMKNIEMDPNHTYSHIKEFCDVLKSLKRKRKVPFTTLSKAVKVHKKNKLKIVGNVIHLDDDDEVPINTAVTNSNIVTVPEKENASGNVNTNNKETDITTEEQYIEIDLSTSICDSEHLTNKVVQNNHNNLEDVSSSTEVVPQIDLVDSETVANNCQEDEISVSTISSSTTHLQDNIDGSDNLFVRRPNVQDIYYETEIAMIERTIATYKKKVDAYSVQEVTEDNDKSPYLQCELFQTKIVQLYKRLCQITGSAAVKRRTVRLRAIDSRPELPIKKLEELINKNIGPDGLPHFPDFEEVVECVTDANFEDNLGWDNKKIMTECEWPHTNIKITENMVIVKSEQTISELDQLGDDFTVTILGVIDPFLVIEISSDSDSEDDDLR
ncbi:hypothetical protein evm_005447 [Chilo suppressalis]|nr:hypothetical protein evm_005447 [Chilo suppressalis]